MTQPSTPLQPEKLDWRKYQKKPVVVSAAQMDVCFRVETLEGWLTGQPRDWLIEGVEGEHCLCKDSVFQATYEEVTPTDRSPLVISATGDLGYPFDACPSDPDGIRLPAIALFEKHEDALLFVEADYKRIQGED